MTKRQRKLSSLFNDSLMTKRLCGYEGCSLPGEFKAPKNRHDLQDYLWFCLQHIRLYNARWDYYSGMNEQEIEHERRLDETWRCPTWPFARKAAGTFPFHPKQDPLNIFNLGIGDKKSTNSASSWFSPATEEGKALKMLKLHYPFTRQELKIRYVELAKRYHPDANDGSREAEERLKVVNRAYEILKRLVA